MRNLVWGWLQSGWWSSSSWQWEAQMYRQEHTNNQSNAYTHRASRIIHAPCVCLYSFFPRSLFTNCVFLFVVYMIILNLLDMWCNTTWGHWCSVVFRHGLTLAVVVALGVKQSWICFQHLGQHPGGRQSTSDCKLNELARFTFSGYICFPLTHESQAENSWLATWHSDVTLLSPALHGLFSIGPGLGTWMPVARWMGVVLI